MSTPFAWSCDDEEERLGMRTILERAGLSVFEDERAGATVLRVSDDDAPRAHELTGQIAAHFVGRVEQDRTARLSDVRERTRRGLWIISGAVALGLLVVAT